MDPDPLQPSDSMSSAPEPELDIDISQLEDIDARRRETAAKGVYARGVLALPNNVPTISLPEHTAASPSIPVAPITSTEPAPLDNQLFVPQPADDTFDDEIEKLRQYLASQDGNVSESNGLATMSREQDQVSTGTTFENPMNLDESQPVVASSSKSPDAPAVTVDENAASEWPEVQEEDSTGFDITQSWYDSLENPSLEETVQYEKAKQQEIRRRERIADRMALEELQVEPKIEIILDSSDDELPGSSLGALHGDTAKRSDMASASRPSKGT
ncbi:hypothetical protein CNMCM5793_005206 [Aspergillus hiratsukae]|uniref:Uncharacterized protein n=1 Tax=Aspergillus hiratsukae TaxID=1194566 RepID=A0A8H6UJ99_9EURO|nr:hypothetical protein CNMCM5793_005206 [Aspergillus hiratsukae]KAF7166003.1 hypothetical protein CNMCM6106_001944 [Aspergillus hiratsukae]